MQNIGIFVNRHRDPDLSATRTAVRALASRGVSVLLDEQLKSEPALDACFVSHAEMLERSDLIMALGGDGTILQIIADAAEYDTPVMGINLGHLGFLTQAEKDDAEFFDKILSGDFTVSRPMMLTATLHQSSGKTAQRNALNDIILRGNGAKMISLEVEVNGTVTNRYLADGIIVATSTGSTAYSLSCGGPIVHQALDCIILTPICPHTLKSRCIVIPPDASVVLRFDPSYCLEADLKADGNPMAQLKPGDYVEITRAPIKAPLVTLNDRNYFDVVRTKLSD
ncbi:MAG: NAD(+)/NADH kinase [Ruminococcaceae bacterium]|nr:NAD(+)/NADH kinase [Oscillospiraceae bacterium]